MSDKHRALYRLAAAEFFDECGIAVYTPHLSRLVRFAEARQVEVVYAGRRQECGLCQYGYRTGLASPTVHHNYGAGAVALHVVPHRHAVYLYCFFHS